MTFDGVSFNVSCEHNSVGFIFKSLRNVYTTNHISQLITMIQRAV